MKSEVRTTTVMGREYKVWSDFIMRCTYAQNEAGEVKRISGSGYIHKDLTVRKAIASVFRLESFRK